MKRSKQELKQFISDSIKDNDDLVIQLLEDIEDSMNESNNNAILDETKAKELEELKWKYEDLKMKYKERFLNNEDDKKDDEKNEEDKELKEKEIVDIKEI